jgi:YfiH family protein|tara:strand:- start:2928 stop:3626 length:699 start_codon:yes stop_codon:yes gene_type:complete
MINDKWISFRSQIKNPHLSALFTYRELVKDEWKRDFLATQAGFFDTSIIKPNQVHSSKVLFYNKNISKEDCDGTFSDNKRFVCSIQVADCMPIYFAHQYKHIFGLVHAGWRGLVNNIIINSGKLLLSKGYNLGDFDIIIGPSIQACCFEVGSDVVSLFDEKFIKNKNNGKFKVKLQQYAFNHLREIGFLKNNISIVKDCTYCMPKKYFSFRREGQKAGRMIGLIGARNTQGF